MARCVCIRCLGTGRQLADRDAWPARTVECELCHGSRFLDGVDPECAAALKHLFPVVELHEDAQTEQVEAVRQEWRKRIRRPVSQDARSLEQRCGRLEAQVERLLARVETLEMRDARYGGQR
jgi:hypothetical protein